MITVVTDTTRHFDSEEEAIAFAEKQARATVNIGPAIYSYRDGNLVGGYLPLKQEIDSKHLETFARMGRGHKIKTFIGRNSYMQITTTRARYLVVEYYVGEMSGQWRLIESLIEWVFNDEPTEQWLMDYAPDVPIEHAFIGVYSWRDK